MNEKLEEYIAKSKADEQESRNQLLISEGLYYDVRLPETKTLPGVPFTELTRKIMNIIILQGTQRSLPKKNMKNF